MLKGPISVVIPCFNERDTVLTVVSEIRSALGNAGVASEVIVVDDGSTDGTGELLQGSKMTDKVVSHRANRGYGAAIKSGIRAASHDYVLLMDADGQHAPESALALLQDAERCDMVIGARSRQGSPLWRQPGKAALALVSQVLAGRRIPDINSGLRVIRRPEALPYLHLCSDEFSFSTSITLAFLCEKLCVRFVPVEGRRRQGGRSRVGIAAGLSTFMLILRTIGTFRPLRVFLPPTLLLGAVGIWLTVQGLIRQNVGDVAVLCLVTSVVLFCFALVADQLALLRRGMNKP